MLASWRGLRVPSPCSHSTQVTTGRCVLTDDEKKRIIRSQIDAFNRHDQNGFVEVVGANAKSVDVPSGETLTGKEGAREFFQRWHSAFPDSRVTVQQELVSGDYVVLQFRGDGIQTGPIGPFPPSNKRATTRFVSINKLDPQGKLIETTLYYDQLSLLAQLGHIPHPAGAGRR